MSKFDFKGSMDYRSTMDLDSLDLMEDTFCEQQSPYGCQGEFLDIFEMLMNDNGLHHRHKMLSRLKTYI